MNTILAFIFALELGFVPSNTMIDWINDDSIKGFTTLEAGFTICDIFYVKGAAKTFIEFDKNLSNFLPLQSNYYIDIGFRFDNISFGFRHFCHHPIIFLPYYEAIGYNGGGEEIYLQFKGKIDIIN